MSTAFNDCRISFTEDELTDLCGALIRAQKAVEKEEQYEFLTDVHVVQVIASSFRGKTHKTVSPNLLPHHFISFILVVKPMTLRKVNSLEYSPKKPREDKERSFHF